MAKVEKTDAENAGTEEAEAEPTRGQKLKERIFPAQQAPFDAKGRGYVPLPIPLRALLWYFRPREWMVLTDVYTRCSKEGVCWFTLGEIGHDIGFGHKGKLRTILNSLIEKGFIAHAIEGGREYYFAVDPLKAITRMHEAGRIQPADRVVAINEVFVMLKKKPLPARVSP